MGRGVSLVDRTTIGLIPPGVLIIVHSNGPEADKNLSIMLEEYTQSSCAQLTRISAISCNVVVSHPNSPITISRFLDRK
jgi:hypothetical protein